MIASLQDNRRLPAYIREYMDAAFVEVGTPEPAFVIQQCMMQYTDLNADIHNKVITDPEVIISKCLEIDGFLLAIVTNVPDGWEFKTVFTDVDSDFVYNGRYDVYYDYWIAQMWNALRTLRVMLNEHVRNTLLAGFSSKPPYFTEPQYTAQFQISTELLYQVQDDVLGTVVQHMGRPLSKDPSLQYRTTVIDDLSPIPMSAGTFLMVSQLLPITYEFLDMVSRTCFSAPREKLSKGYANSFDSGRFGLSESWTHPVNKNARSLLRTCMPSPTFWESNKHTSWPGALSNKETWGFGEIGTRHEQVVTTVLR